MPLPDLPRVEGMVNGPSLINRSTGLFEDGTVQLPSEHEAHDENLAMVGGHLPPALGDPAVHLAIHARFAMTPLGQSLTEMQRRTLLDHMEEHISRLFPVPAPRMRGVQQAGRQAMMMAGGE